MDKEEFAADEVWFGNQSRLTESQELEFLGEKSPVDDKVQEDVAGSAMAAVEATALQDHLEFPKDLPTDLPTESQEPPSHLQYPSCQEMKRRIRSFH
jgi:hypothetical protein